MNNLEQLICQEMEKDLQNFRNNLSKIRSDVISLEVIENLPVVDNKGEKKLLKKLAIIKTTLQKELIIHVFDSESIPNINKTIINSQLGYKLESNKCSKEEIFFSFTPITGETRKSLIKKVKEKTEEGKTSLRNSRHKALQKIKNLSRNEQER